MSLLNQRMQFRPGLLGCKQVISARTASCLVLPTLMRSRPRMGGARGAFTAQNQLDDDDDDDDNTDVFARACVCVFGTICTVKRLLTKHKAQTTRSLFPSLSEPFLLVLCCKSSAVISAPEILFHHCPRCADLLGDRCPRSAVALIMQPMEVWWQQLARAEKRTNAGILVLDLL